MNRKTLQLGMLALLLAAAFMLIPSTAYAQTPEPPPVPDGRLDPGAFSVVPYCGYSGGFVLLRTNPITNQGEPLLQINVVELGNAVARAVSSGSAQLIAVRGGVTVYALPTYEIQITDLTPGNFYRFITRADTCGAPLSSPGSTTTVAPAPVPAAPAPVAPVPSYRTRYTDTGVRVHFVQPGENLFRISLRYGVSLSRLAAVNNIGNTHWIYAGQALIIP